LTKTILSYVKVFPYVKNQRFLSTVRTIGSEAFKNSSFWWNHLLRKFLFSNPFNSHWTSCNE